MVWTSEPEVCNSGHIIGALHPPVCASGQTTSLKGGVKWCQALNLKAFGKWTSPNPLQIQRGSRSDLSNGYSSFSNLQINTSPNQQIDQSIRASTITDPLEEIYPNSHHMGTHTIAEDFVEDDLIGIS